MKQMTSTCSIRSLKRAFIGNSVRMTSDKNTVAFDNVPMKGMIIEDYNYLGFRISHPSLPKSVWVDFEQLPLTRLQINNGIISDEITFVENIVNHKMQLIKTLDTEYIDMIYKEKALTENKDKIIPISEAVLGKIYIGAQCKEGTEMIYLGSFYVKESYNDYWRNERKYYLHKLSPQRAFFAIPENEVSKLEKSYFVKKYFGSEENMWELRWSERQPIEDKMQKEIEQYIKSQAIPRFKIVQFAITSKRIKEVIVTNKEDAILSDKERNLQYINAFLSEKSLEFPHFIITNQYDLDNIFYVNEDKNTIHEESIKEGIERGIKFEQCSWEERYNH